MGQIYSSLKLFRFPDRLEALARGTVAAPVHVRIKPTNVCNHSCWFCAYRNENLELGDTMRVRDYIPLGKMREIIGDLHAMDVRAVTLSGGGEPLVYPYIDELLEMIAATDMRLGILTNGSRLRGALAAKVARIATWARVSIDAHDGESYARSRRVKSDEFERVLRNIRDFPRELGSCLLSVSYIIDAAGAESLFETCARFRDAGVGHVKLSPVIVSTDRDEQNRYHDAIRDRVDSAISRVERELVGPGFSIAKHYHRQNQSFAKPYKRCAFSRLLTVIGADQNVYFCQDKAYTDGGFVASLRDRGFREAWSSPETQERLATLDPSKSCGHHCVAHQKNLLLEDYLANDEAHAEFV